MNAPDRFARSFPAAAPADAHWTDTVVTQGHADYCAAHGYATLTQDGEISPFCPRCGDRTHRAFGIGAPATVIEEIPTPELVAERAAAETAPAFPGATTERRSFAVCGLCGFTNSDHSPSCPRRWSFGWSWSYALTHTVVRGHAEIVDGRRWDDAETAERFRASLPEDIRFQLFVKPVREYVLRDARDDA